MTAQKTIGVIMLNTRFPRLRGDIGNPASFACRVIYETVAEADVGAALHASGPPARLLQPFARALQKLSAAGCSVIGTSCGFLTPYQKPLQAQCKVPFVSSSLLQVAAVQSHLPRGRQVGIITIDSERLGAAHLQAAGVSHDTPVAGLQGGSLHRVIMHNLPELDYAAAMREVLAAGAALRSRCSALGAIVLECTNLGPYKDALADAVGVPVVDVVDLLEATAGLTQQTCYNLVP